MTATPLGKRLAAAGATARAQLPTIETAELVFFGILIAVGVVVHASFVNDDYWIRLASGRYVVDEWAIPRNDQFSFTSAGDRWIDHEWILGAAMYLLSQMNFELLVVLASLIAIAPFYLAYRLTAIGTGRHPLLLAVAMLAATAAWRTYAIRPQLVNPLFFVLVLWVIDSRRRNRAGAPWTIIPLMAVWANLQAGFMAGEALLGCWAAVSFYERRDRTVSSCILIGSLAVPLLNAYGSELYRYTLAASLSNNADRAFIPEWQTPDFHDPLNAPHLTAILVLALVGVRRGDPFRGLLALGTLAASLMSARFVPFFAVSLVWVVGPSLPRPRVTPVVRRVLAVGATSAGVLLLIGIMATATRTAPLDAAPVEAVAYLRAYRGDERVYADQSWANYLAYEGLPVFFDTRTHQVYSDSLIRDYHRVERTRGDWQEVLDRWDIGLVLMRRDSLLGEALDARGWRRIFEEDEQVIWQRP